MKSAPLLLLLSALLLLSPQLRPAAGRPRVLPGWPDGGGRVRTQRLEELLLRAAAIGDAPRLLSDPLLRLLQRRSPGEEEEEEEEEEAPAAKRSDEPPLSIDLTFHLLRNMIQMAKMESQRERAQLNRKVLDEVGK